ncbi:type VI secretion system lipoprotein TssJ [Lelliottia amnigena]|uniref:Type VI secretion system lipoprotein TssJ n=1 Tax=Lelliottia amnigena TaxID=61646 RepID=A0ABU7UJT2_LELAM
MQVVVAIDISYRMLRLGLRISLLAMLGLQQGCSLYQDSQQPDSYKRVHLEAALDVNPNLYGRPSPVLLTLYQLSEAKTFLKADLASLSCADAKPPADAAWLACETFQLSPGELRLYRFLPEPELRQVGVVAEFRDIDNAEWRSVEVFQEQNLEQLKVMLARDTVSIRAIPVQGEPTNDQ